MPRSGTHETADPVRSCRRVSARLRRRLEEFHARAGRDLLVRPSVIDHELAAAFREWREVRIELIDVSIRVVRLRGIAREIEAAPIPVRIVVSHIAELIPEKRRGFGTAG